MNPEISNGSIDDIVIGTTARAWLQNRQALPGQWGLSPQEQARIRSGNICLSVISSPASIVTFSPRPLEKLNEVNLALIDMNSIKAAGLESREIVATLLHECGHVLNKPPLTAETGTLAVEDMLPAAKQKRISRAEFGADDYARHCGFGDAIVPGLEKLRKSDPSHFRSELTEERIARINTNAILFRDFHWQSVTST